MTTPEQVRRRLQFLRGIVLIAALMPFSEDVFAEDTTSANFVMEGCRSFIVQYAVGL
jgi:hypothetical protein